MKNKFIEFVKGRARATISAAKALAAKWIWQEESVDQMETQLEAITGNNLATPPVVGQEELASQAGRALALAEGTWKTQLNALHQWTVQGLNMAKTKFRNDPANLAVVSGLHADGSTPEEILAQALAWESAWGKTAPTWNPSTANNYAAYKALRKQCAEDLQIAFKDAGSAASEETGKLEQMCNDLNDVIMAWYADATKMFLPGTAEGDMIRSSIPTTYTASSDKSKPAPAPATSTGKTP
jgi:hypothetical protein